MSTTIEIVIAIIGTVIAVIEVIGEIRASRAEKREKMRMIKEQQLASEIIQKLKSIESMVTNNSDFGDVTWMRISESGSFFNCIKIMST